MKEKDVQSTFGKYNVELGVFELKLCKGTSLPFDAVAPHQIEALTKVAGFEGMFYKIPDQPVSWGSARMRFSAPKPFDCFRLANIPAYVVVVFYKPRIKKVAYYIDIGTFLQLKLMSSRKSLTEEMAAEKCRFRLNLNRA